MNAEPDNLTNVVAVAAGSSHFLALKHDGTVVAWGDNSAGQTNVPSNLSGVVAIAAGPYHSLALRNDGTVIAWGYNAQGQTNVPGTLSDVVALAAGATESLVLRSNGTIAVWGSFLPSQHQVGISVPSGISNVVMVACGFSCNLMLGWPPAYAATQASLGITTSGATLCGMATPNGFTSSAWFEWGTNNSYGLSTGPTNAGSGISVVRITTGINGLAFGEAYSFRLVVSNALGIAYGAEQRFTTGRRVFTWGATRFGPGPPPVLSNAVAVAVGESQDLVLKADGTVMAWGIGPAGSAPINLSNVVAVAAGGYHSLALKNDGKVVAWGDNTYGQTNVPSILGNVIAIAAGEYHSLALKSDGSVVAWGRNNMLQATNGDMPSSLRNVVAIAAGTDHSVVLKNDGTVLHWGYNVPWYISLPSNNIVAIAGGTNTTLALAANGTVTEWNWMNQRLARAPVDLSNVIAVAAGLNYSLALKEDSTVVTWGRNNYGPSNPSNIVAIAAGGNNNIAIGPDRPPTADDQSVPGYPNQDLLVGLSGSDPDGDNLTFRITTLPALGTLYQYDDENGGRGEVIIATDTPVSSQDGLVIFAPATNEFGSGYANFDFVACDGITDSAPAIVTVDILLPSVPVISSFFYNEGSFELNFSGDSGATYSVWTSTNLVDWELLGNATEVDVGTFQFVDVPTDYWPQRFYRASAL